MLIRVRYGDGRQDMIHSDLLCEMIRRKQIRMFKRYYGWADLSCSSLRERMRVRSQYYGPERRKRSKNLQQPDTPPGLPIQSD